MSTNDAPVAHPRPNDVTTRSHYLITIPGILKIIQMIFDVACFVRMRASSSNEHKRAFWLSFSSGCGFCVTTVLFLFFCFNLIDRSRKLTWIFETMYCILWTVFLLVTSVVAFVWGIKREGYVTAAIFGILAMVFYGIDAFYKCRSWMKSDFTFGDKHVVAALRRSKPTTPTTPTQPTQHTPLNATVVTTTPN